MIRVRQIKVAIENDTSAEILKKISKKLNTNKNNIVSFNIHKKSIDARLKPQIFYVYEVDIELKDECKIQFNNDVLRVEKEEFNVSKKGNILLNKRPVIIGSGPAGLFCAYLLSLYGYNPLIIERGEMVEDRINTVNKFWATGDLNENSNVQFGEGGAGTFSDGKLNTLVKDPLFIQKYVFQIFVENGADAEIMYSNKPHIGTDMLTGIVKNIRNKIISYGGSFRYNTIMTDIKYDNNKIKSIILNDNEEVETDILILAIGHSARDTFRMLYKNNILMTSKPFAIGIRIQHPQSMIDESQYGSCSSLLHPSSYKLTYKASNNRGVYTFCMCPGGYVVNSSSRKGMLAVNGMSYHKRDSENANSAIIVTINKDDFGPLPLDGVKYQEILEKKFYEACNGKIPVQLYGDFKMNKDSFEFKDVKPLFKGDYEFYNLRKIFPDYISSSLVEAVENMSKKIKSFNRYDAIVAGIESRTSSPIKIIRNDEFESNISGIYPCGEGAGYAGGITSSAMDGIKVANQIISKYKGVN